MLVLERLNSYKISPKTGASKEVDNLHRPEKNCCLLESLRFHRENWFEERERFRRIGEKFDKDFDVVWMQLEI